MLFQIHIIKQKELSQANIALMILLGVSKRLLEKDKYSTKQACLGIDKINLLKSITLQ